MCGRYVSPDEASIEREFNLVRQDQKITPSYNVAPTQKVPVIRAVDGTRKLDTLRWGLIPFFAKGEPPKYSTINARIETWRLRRATAAPGNADSDACKSLPASSNGIWTRLAARRPTLSTSTTRPLFGFAGLWDRSIKADGTAIESVVHITMPANDLMKSIHNTGSNPHRMPAILRTGGPGGVARGLR